MGINDKAVFAVAPVTCICRGYVVCKATGFFYKHGDKIYFITNRHVVIDEDEGYYPERLDLKLHLDTNNLRENRIYKIHLYDDEKKPLWLEHPKNSDCNQTEIIDVVAILLIDDISKYSVEPFSSSDLIPDQRPLDIKVTEDAFLNPSPVKPNFGPMSEILKFGDTALVIGYPLGYSDTVHNLPIARNATIASVYSVPFMRRPKILIDSHLHNGTSGSPVLTKPIVSPNSNISYADLMNDKKYLIGIHSGEFDNDNPQLGLYNVWLANLIPDIIAQNNDYFDSLGCELEN
ncbi:MAG: S1 family peptidase [Methanotrichaceae archaeon]